MSTRIKQGNLYKIKSMWHLSPMKLILCYVLDPRQRPFDQCNISRDCRTKKAMMEWKRKQCTDLLRNTKKISAKTPSERCVICYPINIYYVRVAVPTASIRFPGQRQFSWVSHLLMRRAIMSSTRRLCTDLPRKFSENLS